MQSVHRVSYANDVYKSEATIDIAYAALCRTSPFDVSLAHTTSAYDTLWTLYRDSIDSVQPFFGELIQNKIDSVQHKRELSDRYGKIQNIQREMNSKMRFFFANFRLTVFLNFLRALQNPTSMKFGNATCFGYCFNLRFYEYF